MVTLEELMNYAAEIEADSQAFYEFVKDQGAEEVVSGEGFKQNGRLKKEVKEEVRNFARKIRLSLDSLYGNKWTMHLKIWVGELSAAQGQTLLEQVERSEELVAAAMNRLTRDFNFTAAIMDTLPGKFKLLIKWIHKGLDKAAKLKKEYLKKREAAQSTEARPQEQKQDELPAW